MRMRRNAQRGPQNARRYAMRMGDIGNAHPRAYRFLGGMSAAQLDGAERKQRRGSEGARECNDEDALADIAAHD